MVSFVEGGLKVGIVGATGAVGLEVITCLAHIDFPMSSLALYASQRSAGKVQSTPYGDITIELFTVEAARSCQFVLMAVSGDFAKANAKLICADNGPYVIDNSSAFRYDDDIPLVVPEINGKVLSKDNKLIANPNCMYPLNRSNTNTPESSNSHTIMRHTLMSPHHTLDYTCTIHYLPLRYDSDRHNCRGCGGIVSDPLQV